MSLLFELRASHAHAKALAQSALAAFGLPSQSGDPLAVPESLCDSFYNCLKIKLLTECTHERVCFLTYATDDALCRSYAYQYRMQLVLGEANVSVVRLIHTLLTDSVSRLDAEGLKVKLDLGHVICEFGYEVYGRWNLIVSGWAT